MSGYLWHKCKGKYRVLPALDHRTNDVPRWENGIVDPDYDDYYIPSRKALTVRHGYRDELSCLIEGRTIATNILKNIYIQEIDSKLSSSDIENIAQKLIEHKVLVSVDIMDSDVYIVFKGDKLDQFAKFFALRTSGSKIYPLSKKNIYTSTYSIPKSDMETYQEIIGAKSLTDRTKQLQIGRTVRHLTLDFLNEYGDEAKQKAMKLPNKEFIHATGLWNTYLEYLQKALQS